jgi:hypothetical protein
MSDFVMDLEYLRTMRCVDPRCDCGGTGGPHNGAPLSISPSCHPKAPVWLDYAGGDRIIVKCAQCEDEVGIIIVGERAVARCRPRRER